MSAAFRVVVASTNPVKQEAVRRGFAAMFPQQTFEFEGVSAESGVSDQPMGDEETLTGARNRIENARKLRPNADYYAGLEGGCGASQQQSGRLACFAWIVVSDGKREGAAKTGTFDLPPKVAELVRSGMELGHANDAVFSQHNSKQSGGAVGLLTNNVVDRAAYYEQAVNLALIPLLNPELYPA